MVSREPTFIFLILLTDDWRSSVNSFVLRFESKLALGPDAKAQTSTSYWGVIQERSG